MASEQQQQQQQSTQLRLAPHFPFVPKPCAAVAEPFFDCFSQASVQPPGGVQRHHTTSSTTAVMQHPSRLWLPRPLSPLSPPCFQDKDAGRKALVKCAPLMTAYDTCTRDHLAGRKQKVYRAPATYRVASDK